MARIPPSTVGGSFKDAIIRMEDDGIHTAVLKNGSLLTTYADCAATK